MILHRFCSEAEYRKLMSGKILRNYIVQGAEAGHASSAIGFCFFKEDPEEAKHWLSGVVDFDFCLTLEVPESKVRRCYGRYPNWIRPGVRNGSIWREEYCTEEYDNSTFKIIKVSTAFRDYAPNASLLKKYLQI